ncbi:LysR family transcriptional regulator [Novosphingobium sediminicola]|uniref:DNA-binding transcriptional LysR family regulator n=1 Tax=Novosphingobium sediminicola TaxID=563162 RepID=A0A7W6CK44_9SPHN|nr:LysR family transcriptional regulator [Novosphingobium sediminicola]MBB3956119.1 DNA-binding transcriptional LysR family regulator [Novosphingobium sediminicola]
MSTEPSWDLYRTFAAVLREGSLSAAARALGITQPSVARHIEAFEQAVGGKLFLRSQRGLSPTDRALALQPYAEELVAASAAMLRTASADPEDIAGTVRISASEIVATEHLPPMLAAIRRQYPKLSIELVASDAVDDLLQRRADIAIRMVDPVQQALVARRIGTVQLGLYAHRDYLDRRGRPQSIAELPGHDLIGVDRNSSLSRAISGALPGIEHGDFTLRTDNTVVHLAAIRAGFGIGICQTRIAARDMALVSVLPDAFAFGLPLWIVMHEDLRSSARCRTVFNALAVDLRDVVNT